MTGLGSGQVVLALKIGLSDLDIKQSHLGVSVTEQLHDRRETDAGAHHFGPVGMSKLVGHDASGDSGSGNHLVKRGPKSVNQCLTGAETAYQETAVAGRSLGTQSAKALDELADKEIGRAHV